MPWPFFTASAEPADSAGPSPLAVLDAAQAGRVVLEDYRPLADSLDWRLGQEYLRRRGSLAFIGDPEPVPFVVNNDGGLSLRAAEVFFASLVEAEKAGPLPPALVVLELGIGVGLFARFFLDRLRELSDRAGTDYYDRLCYIAADRSARMLRDAGRRGVFRDHPGRYRLRLIDALHPEAVLADVDVAAQGPRPLRAVFLNYLLDCLPAAVLRADGDRLEQLHVRTGLPAGADLCGYTDAGVEELRRLAAAPDAAGREELLAVYPLVVADYQYRPADAAGVPFAAFALEQARRAGGLPVLHSHGALTCLEGLLGLLADGGLVLVNDYGQTDRVTAEEFEHQRFSLATFVGVNFPLLAGYFAEKPELRWAEPDEGETSVHARLLGRGVGADTQLRFRECFGKKTQEWLEQPAQRARQLVQAGRLRAALGLYRQAVERQPFNWPLLGEVAQFLAFGLRDPRAGLAVARLAVARNPGCSAELCDTLGDCLFELGRVADARRAYERALAVNPDDVRARYDLAFVHARQRAYPRALVRIAEALGLDRHGAYRDRLLHKQTEVLGLLAEQQQRRHLGQVDRVAGVATPGVKSVAAGGGTGRVGGTPA